VTQPDEEVTLAQALAENQEESLGDVIEYSDTGNGKRFVRRFGHLVRYVTDIDRWYVWNSTTYQPDSPKSLTTYGLTEAISREIALEAMELPDEGGNNSPRRAGLKWAHSSQGVGHRRRILEEAMANPKIQTEEAMFDAVAHDLVTPSGIVDLETGEERKAKSSDINSRSCTVPYVEEASQPGYSQELDLFLKTFLPNEQDQRFVFAVLGRTLIAGNQTRTFPIIYGGTTSGKSQLMAGIHKVLGSYVCAIGASVFRGNLDDKPRPDLVKAMYTRLAYATEASKSWALHADQIKRLTGGDALPYRNLYEGTVNAYPRFTPVLVTNEMPRITNADYPLKRRILVMHFDKTLDAGQEDPEVKQRFLNDSRCLEALLARLVEGARDPITKSIDDIPQKYVLATMNAFGELDHVTEFIDWARESEIIATAPEGTAAMNCCKSSELFEWYAHWTKKFGDKTDKQDVMGLRAFNAKLEKDLNWMSVPSAGKRWTNCVLLKPFGINQYL
jgi:putative DNA primase/helicase